jgi:RsmE family RNA methyltransferase
MNLVILTEQDFIATSRVRLTGRRLAHVISVHKADRGSELTVGLLGGKMGRGTVVCLDGEALEMDICLDQDPPPKLSVTLLLALPRPKVLNRVIASATSLGVARIVLINAWKVEKAYWKSPRLSEENLLHQRILGLEQAKDTCLPELRIARLFRPFVERELPELALGSMKLVAHPGASRVCPRDFHEPCTLAIGPEGGWIEPELYSLQRAGFSAVDLGPRILRTETALAALVGRIV